MLAWSVQRKAAYASAVCGAAFVAVAAVVSSQGRFPGDRGILPAFRPLDSGATHEVMRVVSAATDVVPLAVVAGLASVALLRRRTRHDVGFFVIAAVGVWVLNPVLKQMFTRSRPEAAAAYGDVSAYGFPSGHAADVAALVGATVMMFSMSRYRHAVVVIGAAVVALVGLSQLVLGRHHPSDVLAGWLWAVAWVAAVWWVRAEFRRSRESGTRRPLTR